MTELRFFTDPGSGVCLWRASPDPTGLDPYAVDHATLPLSANTKAALTAIVALADLTLDWDAPPAAGPHWSATAEQCLATLTETTLAALIGELEPHGYRLIGENPLARADARESRT